MTQQKTLNMQGNKQIPLKYKVNGYFSVVLTPISPPHRSRQDESCTRRNHITP